MAKRRRSRLVPLLVGGIGVLLLAEAAIVAMVFLSPSASAKMSRGVERLQRTWSGTKKTPGLEDRIVKAAKTVNRSWLQPLWASKKPKAGASPFAGCATCHRDYASKKRFTDVYMNHPLHAQLGVACATCHTEIDHPNPPAPDESLCAKCHKEVNVKSSCTKCHPPGSLPHFYMLGAPREGPVECATCHPRTSFGRVSGRSLIDTAQMKSTNRSLCLKCHQQDTCAQCHSTPHPSNWVQIHPQAAGQDWTPCLNCHSSTWCTDRCHSVTSVNPMRIRPLPTGGSTP